MAKMTNMDIISNNLKRMRSVRGLSHDQISNQAGISRQAYSSIEKGAVEPRVKNLYRIADVLGVSVQDIVCAPPELKSLRFRSEIFKSAAARMKGDQIVYDFSVWLNDFNELNSLLGYNAKFKEPNVFSGLNSDLIKKSAQLLRKYLGLKEDEVINDICGLLESKRIKIRLMDFDNSKMFGFSLSAKDGGPAIAVNNGNNIPVERQIFTVAHELGHLILHKNSFDSSKTQENEREEKQADIFASYFLMPEDAFKKNWEQNSGLDPVDRVLKVKRYFKVSYKTVIMRLLNEKRFKNPDSVWRDFNGLLKRKGYDIKGHKEPLGLDVLDIIGDKLDALVRESYFKEDISFNRACEILRLSRAQMIAKIKAWEGFECLMS
jgi:Zn-dependent peptidase ImmA (M78 family)/DNA-binding XRE family transcriptional regulator